MPKAAERFGPTNVVICSMTKTAAAEIGSRDLPIPRDNVGTLHALCYRGLGRPTIAEAEIASFNEENPLYRLSGGKPSVDDLAAGAREQGTKGDDLMAAAQVLRHRGVPTSDWPHQVQTFQRKWEAWMAEHNLVDFTGLIEDAIEELETAPGAPRVLICDESQDLSPLELTLIRKWNRSAEYAVLAGDGDQCQPAGTIVQTDIGPVPIEDLATSGATRVVTYDQRAAGMIRHTHRPAKDHGRFELASCPFFGPLATVRVGLRKTRATANHRWIARWSPEAVASGACCVYLMRQGSRWRVGWCQMFNSEGRFHLGLRARLEKADAAWVLKVCASRTDASVYESVVAAKFGLPTVTFEPVAGAIHPTREAIDAIFAGVAEGHEERGLDALRHHGGSVGGPLYRRDAPASGHRGSKTMVLPTSALLPGYMLLPVDDPSTKCGVQWDHIASITWTYVSESEYARVYSLDVLGTKTYVADGIVTHNSIYGFRGASPKAVFATEIPDDHNYHLTQSYRVPHAVHAIASRWITKASYRYAVEYTPRAFEGEVVRSKCSAKNVAPLVEAIMAEIDNAKSVMLLGTCGYMIQRAISVLKNEGVLFHNQYRPTHGGWNPLRGGASRMADFLRPDEKTYPHESRLWTWGEAASWVDLLRSKDTLAPGAKALVAATGRDKQRAQDRMTVEEGIAIFGESWMPLVEAFRAGTPTDWLRDHMLATRARSMEYALSIVKKRGGHTLREKPLLTVGTCHSTKGGEADVVFLLPDLSPSAMRQWSTPGEGRDSIIRTFYVGMTRAREKLVLCGRWSPASVDFGSIA